jgi:hypothetical protein
MNLAKSLKQTSSHMFIHARARSDYVLASDNKTFARILHGGSQTRSDYARHNSIGSFSLLIIKLSHGSCMEFSHILVHTSSYTCQNAFSLLTIKDSHGSCMQFSNMRNRSQPQAPTSSDRTNAFWVA